MAHIYRVRIDYVEDKQIREPRILVSVGEDSFENSVVIKPSEFVTEQDFLEYFVRGFLDLAVRLCRDKPAASSATDSEHTYEITVSEVALQ